ncbi:MAG: hypothetical protein BWY70_00438 [Bacteroidetes bacterium ADurb.Bin408]|nr:MAG: hypothetical protein BWY70_00438 [Bacteroidetes bacterium ADurb.Bin408]
MIKSMTGYGKSSYEFKGKKVSVEIKALNSKQLDINIKAPFIYRDAEPEMRNILVQKLERGKADVYIIAHYPDNFASHTLNKSLYYKYHDELADLIKETQDKTRELLPVIMQLPDIMKQDREENGDAEKDLLLNALAEAADKLDACRANEGRMLFEDMEKRLALIEGMISYIEPFEIQRTENLKNKLRTSLLTADAECKIDKNRFEQEIIYYLEKMDFTEEKIRLKKHCGYFSETLRDVASNGKKLSFIAQEMGREINTLGAKANDFEIQKFVVQMKDELEKVKEQLMNIL